MSSALTPIGVPTHSPSGGADARPLTFIVLPPQDDSLDARQRPSQAPSFSAAVTRALAGMFAFMFKRPIRLFRPVKISTWAGIQAIAEEQGRSVTPGFVRGLLRKEGWRFIPKHILPPLAINASIGLTLFTSYTSSEAYLSAHLFSPLAKLVVVPFISGSAAGAAQSLLSAPLDNARLLLVRRQRYLRLAHAQHGDARNPRLRRSRAAGTLGGTPFQSWYTLIRDSVFQSARRTAGLEPGGATTATAATATASARERLEQGRRWARRGWSLFSLSLAKDALGFGVFFVIFEVGREGARIAGLRWDGIDPDRAGIGDMEGETLKQRRTPAGLVLQSVGILVSGGVAGWIFSLVARPFERVRGAVFEGRARWAERDGRLRVVEELLRAQGERGAAGEAAGAGAQEAQQPRRARRPRRTSAGGASERRANEVLGPKGRKGFRVRIGRIRTVARSAARTRRRQARQAARARAVRELVGAEVPVDAALERAAAAVVRGTEAPLPPSTLVGAFPPSAVPHEERLPMPSARVLVRDACRRYGASTFLFAPRATLQELDARSSKPSPSPSPLAKPLPTRPVKVGPTRLSARGREAAEAVKRQASGGGWRKGARILTYIPPYAIGFFVYAVTAGDLKIEV
ncbi:uncharacterized protein RHOBADRAFT_54573 [Rhodotorula graminis WP1]|uniref:Mitochondrial carrier n=1 Tax=Rhodotorula graminis (strain WP1) TaxID=578459 RepID=A0A0N8Q032_RHOGW|nr:uncharacterized protein RHOBADRAFT_54573 [Rhodotorula graminis WP1]KPV73997.1 hypothetical protein RHOBADRAFT_54573 [Rhodotorula graminis WP1]